MSDQLNASFAVSDASTASLKKLWSQMAEDKRVFWPRLKGTNPNTVQFLRQVRPQTQADFSQTVTYQLDDAGDFVEDMVLELTLSQIVSVGATFVAYRNDIGAGIIQTIRLFQAGTLLQELRYSEQVFQDLYMVTFEQNQALTESNGILPFATRAARAAAGAQNFFVPLRTLLDYFACPLSILTSAIRVEITFQPLLNLVQYDGATPTANILAANLRVRYSNANPQMMNEMLAVTKGPGMLFPFMDLAFTQNDYAAGTQNIRLLLSEFRSITAYVGGWLRETRQLDDTTGNPLFEFTNSVGFQDWNIQDRGVNIMNNPDNLTPDFVKLHEIPWKFHCYFAPAARFTDFPMLFSWAIEGPEVDLHLNEPENTGYYDFSRSNSAYWNLNIPAPGTANATRLTAYAWFYNVLVVKNGSCLKFTL